MQETRLKARLQVLQYLTAHKNTNISRQQLMQELGLSKSRLSEVLTILKNEGYEIDAPKRSGMLRLVAAEETARLLPVKEHEVLEWLCLFVLSQKREGITFRDLIVQIKEILYPYSDSIDLQNAYTDADIRRVLEECDCGDDLSPRKIRNALTDLRKLSWVAQELRTRDGRSQTVYSLTTVAPAAFLFSYDRLMDLCTQYKNSPTNLSESEFLKKIYNKASLLTGDEEALFQWVYGKSNQLSASQLSQMEKLLHMPYKSNRLLISYVDKKHDSMAIEFSVALLYYSIETDAFYLLGYNHGDGKAIQLRLDRVKQFQALEAPNEIYHAREYYDLYNSMFSCAFQNASYHVKVLFQDFGNIRDKVERLHRLRPASVVREFTPPEGLEEYTILYEDDFPEIDHFSRYLRGYGYSALVLEPAELRQKMIQSSELLIKQYKTYGGEAHD